ncbi:MAG TPA: asparagine synthase (glutamine-hydrolyzing) [Rhodanobacteraceae bacterium]
MCGIASIIEFKDCAPDAEALRRLSDALQHRGPDDDGLLVHENVGLVFRRLSIIDLSSAGHQPMLSESGRYAIVFNGEIFNYVELRSELEARGYRFRSHSDTEVLLNAYVEWKTACLEKLNGMWAFVILDQQTGECFCARDRFGVKPLYYFKTPERVVFASETRAIKASGLYDTRPNLASVGKYLFHGDLDTSSDTFYAGISAVEPGTCMTIDKQGGMRVETYWEIPDETSASVDHAALHDLFSDAVKLRLRSDVRVGVFLSGGMDSTSILCTAETHLGKNCDVSAYSFMSPDFDETRYINDTVAQTHAKLVPLETSNAGLWDQLQKMSEYQDEPVHSPSALIGFCLAELASSDGTKVILNGQGADEVFAGYPSYFRNFWYMLLADVQFKTLHEQLRGYGAHHGVPAPRLLRGVIRMFFNVQLNKLRMYRRMAARHHAKLHGQHPLYRQELVAQLPRDEMDFQHAALPDALRQATRVRSLPLYLRVEDRNSMAHSIEVRLPFLDHRLVSAVMGIRSVRKLDAFWNKAILRQMMQGAIPESVRLRPDKMGFSTPDAKWIRAWAGHIEDIFRSRAFAERGFFNVANMLKALDEHVRGVRDAHVEIFRALQVEQCLR